MAVTLCVGERPDEDYKLWKEAGADRYLLRHETASRELYEKLHPDSDFDNRMRCLRRSCASWAYQDRRGAAWSDCRVRPSSTWRTTSSSTATSSRTWPALGRSYRIPTRPGRGP